MLGGLQSRRLFHGCEQLRAGFCSKRSDPVFHRAVHIDALERFTARVPFEAELIHDALEMFALGVTEHAVCDEYLSNDLHEPGPVFGGHGRSVLSLGVRRNRLEPSPLRTTCWDMTAARAQRTSSSPEIAYWRAGDSGPRVMLLMGFGMRGALWKPQIDGLVRDHQLVWMDNRGVGESARPPGVWTMRDMASDALRVMDELGWDRCHVVGVSMGGMIAQHIAINAEDRLQSLSLIATHEGGFQYAPTPAGLKAFLQAQTRSGSERVQALRNLLYPPAYLAQCDPVAIESRMVAQLGKPAAKETLRAHLYAVATHRAGKGLLNVRTPTLIIKPSLDILIPPKGSERLRIRLPHARMLELEDAGHGAVFQCASTINRALAAHFEDARADLLSRGPASVHA